MIYFSFTDSQIVLEVKQLIRELQAKNMFRGVGGDLMKEVSCFLIMKCSLGRFPVDDETVGL